MTIKKASAIPFWEQLKLFRSHHLPAKIPLARHANQKFPIHRHKPTSIMAALITAQVEGL